MKARKKPVEVEVVRFDGDNHLDVWTFIYPNIATDSYLQKIYANKPIVIQTLEGDMKADAGDFIIKGVQGEFYPIKPDIFEQTYEIVGD